MKDISLMQPPARSVQPARLQPAGGGWEAGCRSREGSWVWRELNGLYYHRSHPSCLMHISRNRAVEGWGCGRWRRSCCTALGFSLYILWCCNPSISGSTQMAYLWGWWKRQETEIGGFMAFRLPSLLEQVYRCNPWLNLMESNQIKLTNQLVIS